MHMLSGSHVDRMIGLSGLRSSQIDGVSTESPAGASMYDIVVKLRNLYPGWETFFSLDGVFVCRPVPTLESGPILYDDTAQAVRHFGDADELFLRRRNGRGQGEESVRQHLLCRQPGEPVHDGEARGDSAGSFRSDDRRWSMFGFIRCTRLYFLDNFVPDMTAIEIAAAGWYTNHTK